MKKALILDVDGTLWDSTEQIAQSYNETMKTLNIGQREITRELICSFMGLVREDIANIVFPDLPYEKRIAYIQKCMDEECEYLTKHTAQLYPHVEETLKTLSERCELYIVSNCQEGYIEALFSGHPIASYIKDYECSGHTGLKKGENIRLLMERNHVMDAIYVGDTQKDKEASDDANIPFVYASYGFGNVEEYDWKIDNFSELADLF